MNNKKNELLLIILSIISGIILLIGGTFSYFTARNRSKDNAIDVTSAMLKLDLSVTNLYTGHKIIPVYDTDIMKAYNNHCKDDLGLGVCLAYNIEVTSYYEDNEILGKIDFNTNNIENLKYMLLDENNNIYLDKTHIIGNSEMSLGNPFMIEGANDSGKSKKFTLVIWLSETDTNQSVTDAGKEFSAKITYNSAYGTGLTASISNFSE